MRQESFWWACEMLAGPAAVELDWKQLAGEEYEAAKAFLRSMQELATRYPCLPVVHVRVRPSGRDPQRGRYSRGLHMQPASMRHIPTHEIRHHHLRTQPTDAS